MQRTYFIFLLLLFFFTKEGLPQTVNEQLTLKKAISLSKQNNLTLKQQEKRIQTALTELSVQKAGYFPTLSFNSSFNYKSELAILEIPFAIPGAPQIEIEAGVKEQYDVNATLQQPIFTGFRTHNKINYAEQQIQLTKAQKKEVKNKILLQIHQLYHTAQLNLLQQEVLQASLTRARNNLNSVKNFYEAGQVSRFDTLKISNQVLKIQTQLNKLQHQQKIILDQIAQVLNLTEISSITPFTEEKLALITGELEDYLTQARQHRPELMEIKHQLRAQQFQRNAVKSGLYPQIFAQASYHYGRPGVNFFEDEWMNYYTVGINLRWHLWNRSKVRNRVQQAKQSIDILTVEEQKIIASIEQEVKQSYRNMLSDIDQIQMSQSLLDQENERYRITKQKFEQGLTTTIDLTDAESSLTAAELQLKQTYISWLKNKTQMDYATGIIDRD